METGAAGEFIILARLVEDERPRNEDERKDDAAELELDEP